MTAHMYYSVYDSGCIIQLMAPFIMGWIPQSVWMLVLVSHHVKELQLKNFHFGKFQLDELTTINFYLYPFSDTTLDVVVRAKG